jgi:hypothetical protein
MKPVAVAWGSMKEGKAARFSAAVAVVVAAAVAGASAGYAVSTATLPAFGALRSEEKPQTSNLVAKADSLPSVSRTAMAFPDRDTYALASADTGSSPVSAYAAVTPPMSAMPSAEPVEAILATDDSEPQVTPVRAQTTAAAPPAMAKPKQPPMGLLDDGQIAGIKNRLRLTAEQAANWPAVETALRAFAKIQLRHMRQHRHPSGKTNIDVNSPEVQQLIWAAMPLLRQLNEDQKREVRKLVRVIGLDQVASQI